MTTKESVLLLLKENFGLCISGEEIARSLHISRSAVWKAIKALREAGYEIAAETNVGYCLLRMPDLLTSEEITPLLRGHAKEYAKLLQIYPSLISTNQKAKELALAGAPHGTAVLAETQTGGRGRYARSFFSPKGGLYLSVILYADRLCFSQITAVTAFAANAVCETVETVTGMQPAIKWVNDVYLDGKKICGILTEGITDLESGGLSWLVVGIGLNISVREADFPPELRQKAGSLYPDKAVPGLRTVLAAELLNRLLGNALPPPETEIFAKYRKRLLCPEAPVTVVQGDTEYKARMLGIDDAGHLLVETAEGARRTLYAGEIRME